jgi:hypothetical protein
MIITISQRFIRVRMPRRSSSRMRMFASAAQGRRHRYPLNRQFSRRSWFGSFFFICLAQPDVDDDANDMATGSGGGSGSAAAAASDSS